MKLSHIHERTDIFYLQKVHQIVNWPKVHRNQYIESVVRDKIVLHVGCVDWPVTDINENLHMRLAPVARSIDGCDLAGRGLEELRNKCPGVYFEGLDSVLESNKVYDCVIAPEVVEHVPNAGTFLEKLFSVPCKEFLITTPNATRWLSSRWQDQTTLVEFSHFDHVALYSPYTLLNACRPYLCNDDDISIGLTEAGTNLFFHVTKHGQVEIEK